MNSSDMDTSSTANGSSRSEGMSLENTPTFYMELIVYPLLLLLCTAGNITTLIFLFKSSHKGPATVYLIVGAVADLCTHFQCRLAAYFCLSNRWLTLPGYITELQITPVALPDGHWIMMTTSCTGPSERASSIESLHTVLRLDSGPFERGDPCGHYATASADKVKQPKVHKDAALLEVLLFFLAALATVQNPIAQYMNALNPDIVLPTLDHWGAVQNDAEVGLTIAKWAVLFIANVMLVVALKRHDAKMAAHGINFAMLPHSSTNMRALHTATLGLVTLYGITHFPNVVYKCLQISSQTPVHPYDFPLRSRRMGIFVVHILVLANYAIAGLLVGAASPFCRKKFLKDRMISVRRKLYRRRASFPVNRAASADTLETFEL